MGKSSLFFASNLLFKGFGFRAYNWVTFLKTGSRGRKGPLHQLSGGPAAFHIFLHIFPGALIDVRQPGDLHRGAILGWTVEGQRSWKPLETFVKCLRIPAFSKCHITSYNHTKQTPRLKKPRVANLQSLCGRFCCHCPGYKYIKLLGKNPSLPVLETAN